MAKKSRAVEDAEVSAEDQAAADVAQAEQDAAEAEERAAADKAALDEARQNTPELVAGIEGVDRDHSYVHITAADSRQRRITIGGTNYEHVSDDSDGVWIYRPM